MKNFDVKYLSLATFFAVLTFPFINFLAVNYSQLDSFRLFLIFSAISISVISIVLIGIAALLMKVGHVSLPRTLAAFCSGIIMFFLFGPITSQIISAWETLGLVRGIALVYLLICAICMIAVYWLAKWKFFHVVAAVFFLSLISISLLRIAYAWAVEIPESEKSAAVPVDAPLLPAGAPQSQEKRNVYYVIVDAYPRHDMAKTYLSYSNKIESELEKRGFHNIKDARSSYFATYFTLGSIFHGGYQVIGKTPDNVRQNQLGRTTYYPEMLDGNVEPNLVTAVKKLDYKFYVVGNVWARCRPRYVRCFAFESGLYLLQNGMPYEIRLFIDSTPIPVILAHIDPLLVSLHDKWKSKSALNAELITRNDDTLPRMIARIKSGKLPAGPYFMFLHNISPHPPFRYNSDCSLRKKYKFDFENWSERAKKEFVINMKCTNRMMIEFADLLEQVDPDAIVVFQSDHGTAFTVDWHKPPALWSSESIHERTSIFNFIRSPKECDQWIRTDLNNVNTVRFVLGCMMDRQPKYIRNDTYIGQYGRTRSTPLRLVH